MELAERKGEIKCALCGTAFDPHEHKGCTECPIRRDCGTVCCPNCGYQIPEESKLVKWMKRRLNK